MDLVRVVIFWVFSGKFGRWLREGTVVVKREGSRGVMVIEVGGNWFFECFLDFGG